MKNNYMEVAYPQRRTLIKHEKWPEIDGWYWASESIVSARIEWVLNNDRRWIKRRDLFPTGGWGSFWINAQWELGQRLAHACPDGRIRAATNVQVYRGKSRNSIYGKCAFCNTKLSQGVKTIMMLEGALDERV